MSEEKIEVPANTTILQLLRNLSDAYGEWFRKEVLNDEESEVGEGLVITINGVALGQMGKLATKLKEGDEIMLLPFFAGGG
jgi:molybdopterin converting factor small subunit